MFYETLIVSKESSTAIITLNRPEVMNAINDQMRIDLHDALDDLRNDPGIGVVILTGSGNAFSAGADLREFKRSYEAYNRERTSRSFGGPDLALSFVRFPKPMIAAVNGLAVGWGMTMPLTCDIRIASDRAKFSSGFVKIGLTPEFGSCHILPRVIGFANAAELMLTARIVDADEANRLGFINRVAPHEQLIAEAMAMASLIAAHPPESVQKTKALLRRSVYGALEEWITYEASVFGECANSKQHYEAVMQFMEARAAKKTDK